MHESIEYHDVETDETLCHSTKGHVPRKGERVWGLGELQGQIFDVIEVCWWAGEMYTRPCVYLKRVSKD